MEEKISVIIPTWNRANVIGKSIESVILQGDLIAEIIIIDDNSNDNTEEMVKNIKDERVVYIRLNQNVGPAKARNIGIDAARYEYIAFHDSDDVWYKNKIKKQLKILKSRKVDIIASGYIQNKFGIRRKVGKKEYINYNSMFNELLRGNFVGTPTILGKSECFKLEKFDEEIIKLEDWELAIRLAKKYRFEYHNEYLMEAIIQENSVTLSYEKDVIAFQQIYYRYNTDIINDFQCQSFFEKSIGIFYLRNNEFRADYFRRAFECNKNTKNFISYFGGRLFGYRFLKKIHTLE